jgi:hypothetical protein
MAEQGIDPWVAFAARGDIEESLRDEDWLHANKDDLLA